MAADPEPCDRVIVQNTERAAAAGDARRPDVIFPIDTLEMKRGMEWILGPEAIGLSSAAFIVLVEGAISGPEGGQSCRFHS